MSRITSAATLAAVAFALALAIPASASSPLQPLSLTKTCDVQATPCTVIASNVDALPVGTVETYLGPEFGFPVLSSRVLITSTYLGGGTATGHCTWPLRSAAGTCTFAQGTGSLTGFQANLTGQRRFQPVLLERDVPALSKRTAGESTPDSPAEK